MAFPTKNLLTAIQTTKVPPQFDKQFLESLEFKSPSDQKIIGVLKALKFISNEGAPTKRYCAFLDRTQAPAILAEAIIDGYSDLFHAHIKAQTNSDPIDPTTFAELCRLADFQTSHPERQESKKDDIGTPEGEINENEAQTKRWKKIRVDGFVYRVLIVSPKPVEPRRRAPRHASRWTLPASLMAIIAVAALVSIFGGPLYRWSKATTVFRPFLASEMSLARPAVRTPANSN
jgi:Family of unknown function (DUF5343)